jgi:hypothetical protein
MWTDAELEARMKRGWAGGLGEGTPCGNGSLLRKTASVRWSLPLLMQQYGIKSVCDAGAGDMHWAQDIFDGVDYRPFDLVPRSAAVTNIDISKTALPPCDAIICRLVLIHLDPKRVQQALKLFAQSAKYLFATQYELPNVFNSARQFNRVNLSIAPYDLGEPMERIPDIDEAQCSLAMWRL